MKKGIFFILFGGLRLLGQTDAGNPFGMDLDSLANTKVTTASKFAEKLSEAPGVMTVVSRDELRRFGGITLREVLERVSGLTGTTGYFTDRSMVAARGLQTRITGGHVLVLINGRPVREVLEGGVISDVLESFPVNVIERVEVIKGPGSVLYGSDAFAGVINVITTKAAGKSFHFRGGGSGAGSATGSGEVLWERGAFGLVAAGQYRRRPNWDVLYRDVDLSRVPFAQRRTVRDEGTGSYLGMNYKGLSFEASYTGLEMPTFVSSVGSTRWKRGFADLGYRRQITDRWETTLNLTYTRMVLDAPDPPYIHRDAHQSLLEWTNFVSLSDRDQLTVGALVSRQQGREIFMPVQPQVLISNGSRGRAHFTPSMSTA